LLICFPLLLLVVDFCVFPRLLTSRSRAGDLTIEQLFAETAPATYLGRFSLHELYASTGSFTEAEYLQRLRAQTQPAGHVALVATVFADDTPPNVGIPQLLLALMNNMTPASQMTLANLLYEHSNAGPGSTYWMALQGAATDSKAVDVDRLYLIHLPTKPPGAIRDALAKGLVSVFQDIATQRKVNGLILPFLAVGPDSNGLTVDDFMDVLLKKALKASQAPRFIYLSPYSQWPPEFQESVFASLTQHLTEAGGEGLLLRLYRFEWRLALLSLTLCLFICSKQVPIGPKAAIVIAVAYISMLLESFKLIEWAAAVDPQAGASVAIMLGKSATAIIEALGFPHFVRWGVKELFTPGAQGT